MAPKHAALSGTRSLTYQPYVFAMALLALLAKVVYSLAKDRDVIDYTFGFFALVFVVSSAMYYFQFLQKPAPPSSLDVRLQTGRVSDTDVLGAEAQQGVHTKVNVRTGDISRSTIAGYKEKEQ